ncbi:ENTS family enterobactin (siderophore) exporter [Spinactinospora alkalitolerans]|uniref:ENTS family enterobactin (Siderophore) exporter n=1 Tax=Spinactinospora alkalitolerans TaxID=687207 RepID=A0A852TVJ2_9ACTN|nr:enterobactin transporter EntS [Spinactinospora alkalitolerans]NYE46843.1 ENTS family enterobactin (siderophore) exporter [Spinactinospora alkalitolerans]
MQLARLVIDLGPLRAGGAFRILFAARLISLFGGGFRMVALPLQVYAMTQSSFLVASVGIVNGVASFAGTLIGGLLADRLDRRRLVLAGLGTEAAVVALFAVNTYLPPEPVLGLIYVGAAVNGVVGTIGLIAQQSVVPALVGRDRLAAAGALFALTAQLGAMAAPALGGALISAWGVGIGYVSTSVIAAVAMAAVWFLPLLRPTGDARLQPVLAAVGEGLRFVAGDAMVRPLLLLGFVQVLFATPMVLVPEFTDRVLGGDAALAGLLYTAPAAGALLASLTSGWTGRVRGGGAIVTGAVALCGVSVAALGASSSAVAAITALMLLGFGQAVEEILRYALLQAHTPDALRGRVNSAWLAQATVGGSLGATVLGLLAALAGPAAALVAGGALCVGGVAAIAAACPGLRRGGAGGG